VQLLCFYCKNDKLSFDWRFFINFWTECHFLFADFSVVMTQKVRESNPVWGEIFRTCPYRPCAHPAFCTTGTVSFPGVKSGRDVKLNPHPLLVPWSRKSRAIPLLPLWPYSLYRASVPVQKDTLYLLLYDKRNSTEFWAKKWYSIFVVHKNVAMTFNVVTSSIYLNIIDHAFITLVTYTDT